MGHTYYFDIETVPLEPDDRHFTKPTWEKMKWGRTTDEDKRAAMYEEAVRKWETGDGVAVDSAQNRIVLAGMCVDDGDYHHLIGDDGNELELIKKCFSAFAGPSTCNFIVGHCVGFDIRNLIRRAWILGYPPPRWLINEINKYKSDIIFDTMQVWQLNDRSEYISLDVIAGAFGVEQPEILDKEGNVITGKTFFKHWAIDREACIEYNKSDVLRARDVAKKLMNTKAGKDDYRSKYGHRSNRY